MTNKNTIADMSVTPANNQDILGQNATGGADANTIETLFQNTWGILARAYGDQGGLGTVGGSANAITLTSLSTYQALTSGMQIGIKPTAANTGATTLNLDTLGAKKVRLRGDAALPAGALAANGRYLLQYDAAYDTAAGAWVLLNPEIPSSTYQPYDADLVALADTGVAAFSGLIYGLTLSNNGSDATNDIDVAAGIAIDSTNAKFIKLASGITKRLDAAWAVGTNQGGRDTGSIADGWWHIWLIMRSDTGVVDALFSLSATAPTMPASYDYKRRIGAVYRSTSIKAFKQLGDLFIWDVPVQDDSANASTTARTVVLTVPTGIQVVARILFGTYANASTDATYYYLVTSTAQTDTAPSSTIFTLRVDADTQAGNENGTQLDVPTDTSGQIRTRASANTAAAMATVNTVSWTDTRGR